ncbi:MAG: sulfurtransferase [Glaciimonas sp.]|nr:sulfurtransferase [Glaciimonas sp.]
MSSTLTYVNIAAYKFITFDDTADKRAVFLTTCTHLNLKGTIVLSPEGINLFLAGFREEIDQFLTWLRGDTRFSDLEVKESYSENQPFTRMLVKLKAEIITMKYPLIKPELGRAPSVTPRTLKRWLDQGHDDNGHPVIMLDTRNSFEVDIGTFSNTVNYRINKFSEFPEVISAHKDTLIDKTIVTFCTGGIRCEKAAIHMQEIGFNNVYQLDGGILKYFEECGGAQYNGDCFVFDYRTALNPQLQETAAVQCFVCRTVVTPKEQLSPEYIVGKFCPHCPPKIIAKQNTAV